MLCVRFVSRLVLSLSILFTSYYVCTCFQFLVKVLCRDVIDKCPRCYWPTDGTVKVMENAGDAMSTIQILTEKTGAPKGVKPKYICLIMCPFFFILY